MKIEVLQPAWAIHLLPLPGEVDPTALVRDRRGHATSARRIIDRVERAGNLFVDVRPRAEAPPLPVEHCAAQGASPEALKHLHAATHVVVVAARSLPEAPVAHAPAARSVAVQLGDALRTDVVDATLGKVLERRARAAAAAPEGRRIQVSHWLSLVGTPCGEEDYRFRTRGLGVFGLPELQVGDVPGGLFDQMVCLLPPVAQHLCGRLLAAEHVEPDGRLFVDVGVPLRVTAAEFARSLGRRRIGSAPPVPVYLRFDPRQVEDGDDHLTVEPPPERSTDMFECVMVLLAGLQRTLAATAPVS